MFESLLERIATTLDVEAIPHMVIGGQAVLVHGEPRLTRDIGIALGVDIDRLGQVVAVTAALGFTPLVDPGGCSLRVRRGPDRAQDPGGAPARSRRRALRSEQRRTVPSFAKPSPSSLLRSESRSSSDSTAWQDLPSPESLLHVPHMNGICVR
jgi:hypothetical protein